MSETSEYTEQISDLFKSILTNDNYTFIHMRTAFLYLEIVIIAKIPTK